MHFRIYTVLCWAVLAGLASAAQINNDQENTVPPLRNSTQVQVNTQNGNEIQHKKLLVNSLTPEPDTVKSNQRGNNGFSFKDTEDADIEGSGGDGELNRDLESSGSGGGPDDEDTEDSPRIIGVFIKDVSTITHVPKLVNVYEEPDIDGSKILEPESEVPSTTQDSGVVMNPKSENGPTSFFAQPGILAAVIGGAVVGLLCAILVVMFIVYRMRKKDEGSYALGEPKQSPNSNSYSRGNNKEFYA